MIIHKPPQIVEKEILKLVGLFYEGKGKHAR